MKAQLKSQKPSQQTKRHSTEQTANTTFLDHVVELRTRALWVGLFLIASSALTYSYHDVLLKVIMAPLHEEKLIYLTPGGGFSFIFLISLYAGLLATIPVFIYHLHAFIKPALPLRAQRSVLKIILASTLLISMGVAYGYFIAIPAALQFLTTFAGDAVTPNLTADSYLNFFLAYIGGLALLSLLPLILMFTHWIKPLKPGGLLKSERWVVLFAFIAAAIITPTPDIVNQAMIALPVIGIYQLGVVAVFVAILKEKKRSKKLQQETAPQPAAAHIITPVPAAQTPIPIHPRTSPVKASTSAVPQPARMPRTLDGFRKTPPKLVVAPRTTPAAPQGHPMTYPVRTRNLDGIMIRRTQITQN